LLKLWILKLTTYNLDLKITSWSHFYWIGSQIKSDEVAYANDSIIFQHHQQQQQQQQQQGMMYSAGGDLSDAPLPPLPLSGPHNSQQQQQQQQQIDPIQSDRYYSSQQRHSRHSLGLDSEFWFFYQTKKKLKCGFRKRPRTHNSC